MQMVDLSVVFQRWLERSLSGLALAHPLEAIPSFKRVDSLMVDEISIAFLNALWMRESELQKISPDSCVIRAIAVSTEINPAALLDGLNQTGGYSEYEEFPLPEIFKDLEQRIADQAVLRRALPDLAQFVDRYLGDRYASR